MHSAKDKICKRKLLKIDMSSGSDSDVSEHELSYYAKDKVKLMKEVLKLIKPKKIKSMAPDCIKDLDIVEINSMLLEELLGISNKRLQYIFNGENVDRETSSSESEEEKQSVDVISLDDISDDDDIELCISQNEKECLKSDLTKKSKKHKSHKMKTEVVDTVIKTEKAEKSKKENRKKSKKSGEFRKRAENLNEADKDKLMSVLELLELQARARAIRSQLALENEKKESEAAQNVNVKQEDSDSDAVIIESPKHKEIVINSSDSEGEGCSKALQIKQDQDGATSKLFKHFQDIDSSSGLLLKQQKSHSVQDHNPSNSSKEQQSSVEDVTINLDDTDDEIVIKKGQEKKESDKKRKKEKFLAKIQKIKLIRYKIAAENKLNIEHSNIKKRNDECHNIKEMNNEQMIEHAIESEEMQIPLSTNITNEVNIENHLQEFINDFDIKSNNDKNIDITENVESKEKQKVNVNEDVKITEFQIKSNDVVSNDTGKIINVNDCDNDEIVINLDENEMDGIENV